MNPSQLSQKHSLPSDGADTSCPPKRQRRSPGTAHVSPVEDVGEEARCYREVLETPLVTKSGGLMVQLRGGVLVHPLRIGSE